MVSSDGSSLLVVTSPSKSSGFVLSMLWSFCCVTVAVAPLSAETGVSTGGIVVPLLGVPVVLGSCSFVLVEFTPSTGADTAGDVDVAWVIGAASSCSCGASAGTPASVLDASMIIWLVAQVWF